jgi:hypothetical protein
MTGVRNARWRALLAALVLAAAPVAGCGVPTEDAPRVIEQPVPGRTPSTAPAVAASGPASERLYLVRDGALVAVQRRLPREPDPQHLLADLLAGPTEAEQARGLRSALAGSDVVVSVDVWGVTAYVEIPAAIEGTGRNDDVLAFGQIVCTLTSRTGIERVVFTRRGAAIGVPLPDASLSQDPLRAADYAGLIADA